MLSKNYAKLINSLSKKKFRQKYELFVVEGVKSVEEVLNSDYEVEKLFYTDGIWENKTKNSEHISEQELKKISFLSTPNQVLALVKLKKEEKFIKHSGITLVLDEIRDPGNLGTIIRLADWFGVQQIVCSNGSVDLYNPKSIQSCMGSFLRVNVFYENLIKILRNTNEPIIGTFMNGKNIYKEHLPQNCYLILGNEANGISTEIEQLCTERITIPQFGTEQNTESLNVAMATAICLSQWKGSEFGNWVIN